MCQVELPDGTVAHPWRIPGEVSQVLPPPAKPASCQAFHLFDRLACKSDGAPVANEAGSPLMGSSTEKTPVGIRQKTRARHAARCALAQEATVNQPLANREHRLVAYPEMRPLIALTTRPPRPCRFQSARDQRPTWQPGHGPCTLARRAPQRRSFEARGQRLCKAGHFQWTQPCSAVGRRFRQSSKH